MLYGCENWSLSLKKQAEGVGELCAEEDIWT